MEKQITIISDINVPIPDLFDKERFKVTQIEQADETLVIIREKKDK